MYFHAINNYILKRVAVVSALLLLIHAAFLVYAYFNGAVYTKDSYEYLNQAENIIQYGNWYCGDFHETVSEELFSQRPPLYGTLLLLIRQLNQSDFLIQLVQALLSLLNFYIAFLILKRYAPSNVLLLLTALFFFPSQLIYISMVMSEMLLQTMVMLSIYFLIRYLEKKKTRDLLLLQLFLSAAILTKPVFIAFPVITALILMYATTSRKKIIAAHLIPLAVIIWVSFINYKHTGYFEYSSIARKLAINYHALNSTALTEGEETATMKVDSVQKQAAAYAYPERARMIQSGAGRLIALHSGSYIILTLKGIVLFFTDHSRYDLALLNRKTISNQSWFKLISAKGTSGIEQKVQDAGLIPLVYFSLSMCFHLFLLIGLIRFLMIKTIGVQFRMAIGSAIIYTALLTGMTGGSRFRIPVFLLILIASMIALQHYKFPFLKKKTE
jgi:hypothetical protein